MEKSNLLYGKALEYSVRGYSILPLRKNKLPLVDSWKHFQQLAAGEEQIAEWWEKNPAANVGIITGKISGITVVDIDVSGDKAVPLDTFPRTHTVKTPTGGYHLYYQYCPDIQQTANTFPQFPHVDIRNDGGYVVAPPSQCDYVKEKKRIKGSYKIERNFPVAPFPLSLFSSAKKVPPARATSLLKSFKGMEEGDGRNVALTKAVGKLLKLSYPSDYEDTAYPIALSLNKQFKTPLPEKEVRTIFDSIAKKELKKPLSSVEFLKSDKGVVIVNEENVFRTIKADAELAGHFRDNTFAGVIETNFDRDRWEPIQRVDITSVQMYLMRTYAHFEHIPHGAVEDAIMHYVKKNRCSPPADWLRSLVWDKTSRLDSWLSSVYGVPEDAYHQAVGSNVLKGLVRRIIEPGCKFDYVLVLEGRQGMKKSTSFSVLGAEWYVETVFTPENKDFFMLLSNKAIVEFSEGETLSRTEAKRLKAVITMQHDKYRPPYARSAMEFPRQCIFVMTTNQGEYLKDETGNRRWLPITCVKEADVEWLAANREQLFAEAYFRVIVQKEKTYEFPEEETRAQQEARQTADPREEQIYDWYFKILSKAERDEGITTRDAYLGGVLGVSPESAAFAREMNRIDSMIIGQILREGLMLDRKRIREKNERFYRYYPSDASMKMAPKDIRIEARPVEPVRVVQRSTKW